MANLCTYELRGYRRLPETIRCGKPSLRSDEGCLLIDCIVRMRSDREGKGRETESESNEVSHRLDGKGVRYGASTPNAYLLSGVRTVP